MWCIAEITPQYRERMYRILELYDRPYDPNHPVVCMDEKSKQLLEELRKPIAMKPGRVAKHDYEYKRNETRNIFVAVEPKAGKRMICVTKTRKKADFAHFIKNLVKIGSEDLMKQRLQAWTTQRNSERKKINWTFTKQDADQKLSNHYVV